ncbi:DUF1302 domain-containing protein [Catenovulum sediminis]|uniref:DUF1302 domain-containing protein n=1 Tax=Catenovulum sediminis TaxID=1740262 RepID=A0ABV1RLC2_9ALTE|nr:DUF1302 domain-containing protein [Catenovulum sediminis]
MKRKQFTMQHTYLSSAIFMALTMGSPQATAAQFEIAGLEINFDSAFTLGTSYRVEDRDWSLIGKNNQTELTWRNTQANYNGEYNAAGNIIYQAQDVWAQPGSYSANGDLANLNHDPGEAFSRVFSGTHELDINAGDWGFFSRFMYFYDDAAKKSKAWTNPVSKKSVDICRNKEAKERVCQDFRFLDAFLYGYFDIGDMPVSLRIGDQVVSWGESSLISHGVNAINPVDISRLKAPGAELKEAFIPVGMVWGSIGLTNNLSFDAFYQYKWEKTILPAPGSYFSTNDFAGNGGYYNNVQIGFTQNPDMDADYLAMQLSTWVKDALTMSSAEIDQTVVQLNTTNDPQQKAQLAAEFYDLTAPYYVNATKVAIMAQPHTGNRYPSDDGQYGFKFTYYSPELNDTEFGLYYMNYHSRRPLISGRASNFEIGSLYGDVQYLLTNGINVDNLHNLKAFTQAYLEYPEDIQLYGFSFNTSIGTTALAGEIAYRQDEPLQIDDVELLYMGMPEQLANANLRPDLKGISQLSHVESGGNAQGYIRKDTVQAQATLTHLFGPTLGADALALLFEAGVVQVQDMPEQSELRLNGPGTARSGVLPSAQGLQLAISDGAETTPFPTATAWGYRAVARLTYNNVFSGVNVTPRLVYSHDVKGTTPDPMFLFVEDRQSASLSLTFDYQNKIQFDMGYNAFWGGLGNSNNFADRDYISFSIKYSI